MNEIYINPVSKKIIDFTIKNLPQSLLLFGDEGIGLSTISQYIVDQLDVKPVIVLPEKDEKIDVEKGIISIDIMRRLYDDTRTIRAKRHVIVIDYVERMTHQAQNAFLKLLEEPNSNTHFIMLTHSTTNLLPTIMSRVQKINIKPISEKQSNELLDSLLVTDAKKRSQLLFIAAGLPAEITRLCSDDEYFESRSKVIRDARDMLRGTTYEKLKIANSYKDDRIAALRLLTDMMNILKRSISDDQQSESINKISSILGAYQNIEQNGNIRICLAQVIV